MNPSDAATILTVASGIDNRTITPEVATIWAQSIDESVSVGEACKAVTTHYSTSTEFVKPAHINAIVQGWRRVRARDLPPVIPPSALADIPEWETAWRIEWQDAMIAGHTEERSREIANRKFNVIERDEPLALESGPAAAIKAQMQDDILALARKKSLREVEARAKAEEQRQRFAAIRASELAKKNADKGDAA